MMRSVVVLPAPFGPSRPKIDPRRTEKLKSSTARIVRPRAENIFARFCTTMADVDTDGLSFESSITGAANGQAAHTHAGLAVRKGKRTRRDSAAERFHSGLRLCPRYHKSGCQAGADCGATDRKSTRLNSSHLGI